MSITTHLAHGLVPALPHVITAVAGGGILDWSDAKINQVTVTLRSFAIVAGIGFVIYQAIASRGAMARIIISGLAAGVFIWIVFNVTNLRDRVGTELNSSPSISQITADTAPPPVISTAKRP